jgi:hypothetical protein
MRTISHTRLPLLAAGLLATAAHAQPSASAHDDSASVWSLADAVVPPGAAPTPTSVRLVRGMATRADVSLRDGVVEFDLAPPEAKGGQFAGVAFRMASSADYEIVYFRSSDDGVRWAGMQYQPVFQGETTWQLYSGAGYEATLPPRGDPRVPHALHVRLVVRGSRADVFVDGAPEPALRVTRLQRAPTAGPIGVWAISPDGAAAAVEHLAVHDVPEVTDAPNAPNGTEARAPAAGQLMRWRVSARLPSPDGVTPPPTLGRAHEEALRAGTVATAEPDGLVNLTRWVGNAAGPQRTNVFGGAGWGLALARVVLVASHATRARLHFGYSDGLGVYLDGEPLFVGRNDYDSRYQGYIGTMSRDGDAVDLPLRKGRNVLTLAVTDRAFGWGFAARLEDVGDVRVEVP